MGSTGSLEATDLAAKAVQKTPNRVSLDSLNEKIDGEYYFLASDACEGKGYPVMDGLSTMTICVLRMRNGFIVIGKSAPADPANFNEELGRKFSREDAIRQLWPLEGYALRERLSSR